ncbi:IS5 family transposase [Kocuria marina]|uniref:IS5 family transposase n=1 Tax=Kocuria marina TaxID=223184 RepID=UPI001356477C|nr:IS5 family transposase [Kocuria indica]
MSRTSVLTDEQWERIQPLLPSSDGSRGRPFRDDRPVVEGILYRYRCGIAWRDVPEEFGPWQTVWKRHRRYSGDGTWDRILAALLTDAQKVELIDWAVSVDSTINRAHQHATNFPRHTGGAPNYTNLLTEPADHAVGRSRGGLSTKIHALVDGAGRPLVVLVGPGQGGDSPMFPALMSHLRVHGGRPGPPRTRPERLRADKAYSSRAIRAHLRSRKIAAVIPEPADQQGHRRRRGSRGGRPPAFDAQDYRGRNVVERSFNLFKQWRGLATRYDKLALTYRGGAVLRAITIWLKALLGDMP